MARRSASSMLRVGSSKPQQVAVNLLSGHWPAVHEYQREVD
jgi:hypothetical protein